MTIPARISIGTIGVADLDGHAREACCKPSVSIGPDGRTTID